MTSASSNNRNNSAVRVGSKFIGPGHPCFVIAEIGINHNGDIELAKRLITVGLPRCVRLALAFLVAVNVTAAGLVVDLIDEAGRPQRFHGVHQMDET